MSCYFNWTPNGQWAIGASVQTHLPGMLKSLRDYAIGEAVPVPEIVWMSRGVSVDEIRFDATRVLFGMDYSVVHAGNEDGEAGPDGDEGDDRGKATVVWRLSRRSSWDIDFTQRTGELVDPGTLDYRAGQRAGSSDQSSFLYFRLDVPPPPPTLYIKRYRITLERTMGNPDDVRFNGSLCTLGSDVDTPICRLSPTSLLGDSSSVLSDMSLKTNRTLDPFGGIGGIGIGRAGSILSLESGTGTDVQELPASPKKMEQRQRQRSVSVDTTAGSKGVRSKSQDKTVASLIKRNYIRQYHSCESDESIHIQSVYRREQTSPRCCKNPKSNGEESARAKESRCTRSIRWTRRLRSTGWKPYSSVSVSGICLRS